MITGLAEQQVLAQEAQEAQAQAEQEAQAEQAGQARVFPRGQEGVRQYLGREEL